VDHHHCAVGQRAAAVSLTAAAALLQAAHRAATGGSLLVTLGEMMVRLLRTRMEVPGPAGTSVALLQRRGRAAGGSRMGGRLAMKDEVVPLVTLGVSVGAQLGR
jgi:hypothetical protein